ncbi:NAD-dependent epimerase/dehydratase family protein [Thalassospira povalilytica]|uniref:NAD(P)-dependent oxidoreductase n=1 Tax=Thalassospira povalilytica TaxID=732237 RepID=A0A8I1MA79_9PROT|nr:NAD(P)-dependent oxidoreductase [Thalassospira povalilytica]MBN8197706.1 NAD(P)-dependent oxidoreductase [Thalassospira povalilytica]
MKRLLITGAGGNLGKICREGLKGYADVIRLSDISPMDPAGPNEEVVQCNLSDRAAVIELTKDVDGIIHLGGISIEAAFDDLLQANLAGTYNLYEGARQNGVGRIMFASSNHAIGFHKRTTKLDDKSELRPDSLYGVTKCYGEAVASYYYDKFDVETVSVRIGSCFEKPRDRRMLSTWLSPRDFLSLMKAIFDAPMTGHLVVYGVSDNKTKWWSNDHADFLGWKPQDSSEQFRAEIEAAFGPEDRHDPAVIYQGGGFAAKGHFED